ncbi:MAG: pseudouridine synthase [Burkholderiaceae bacterium]
MPLILFNKPFGVLCQFSRGAGRPTLADYLERPGIYPAGRLDAESEGLILLTDDGALQHRISHPEHKAPKSYLVQIEGVPSTAQLSRLQAPIDLGDFLTLSCKAVQVEPPDWLWPREPPIRTRAAIPTSWLQIVLKEGKNRQVRRMTAYVGLPTLRLIRVAIGPFSFQTSPLWPGESCVVSPELLIGTRQHKRC